MPIKPLTIHPVSAVNLGGMQPQLGAGTMIWWGAQAWVNYLNVTRYAGVTGWRLPSPDVMCMGFCELGGELRRMYNELDVLG